MKKSKIFKVYLIYFICMALFCTIRIISSVGLFNFMPEKISDIIFTLLIQVCIMFVLPLTLYTLIFNKEKGVKETFKETTISSKCGFNVILISLAIGVLAFFLNIGVSTLFNGIISFFGYSQPVAGVGSSSGSIFPNWLSFIIDFVLIAILPAFCEEFMHRGIMLNGLKEIGIKKAIVISSLLFGLLHFNINQFFYAFILGMLMALVTVVSKSIYPAMIIHFTNNAISIYLSSAQAYNWFGKDFYVNLGRFLQGGNFFLTFLTTFAFFGLIMFLIIILVEKLFKLSTLNRVQKVINSIYTDEDRKEVNSPEVVEKSKMIQNMLENNSNLNLDYEGMKSPLDLILPKQKNIYKPTLEDNMFLISSLVLSGLITVFTFIWGFIK